MPVAIFHVVLDWPLGTSVLFYACIAVSTIIMNTVIRIMTAIVVNICH